MDQDVKQRWIGALLSGRYRQGKGKLRRGDEFCCLGVLLDVLDPDGWHPELKHGVAPVGEPCHVLADPGKQVLSPATCDKIGIPFTVVPVLTGMNDGLPGRLRRDFAEIAQWIRENL